MSRSENLVVAMAEIKALSDEERIELLTHELIRLRHFVNTHKDGLDMIRSFGDQYRLCCRFDARGMLEDQPSE